MIRQLKMSLAPSATSFGIQNYWAGKPNKALKWFERANRWWPELIPGEPLLLAYLGLIHARLGHRNEALPMLEQALPLLEHDQVKTNTPDLSDDAISEIRSLLPLLRACHESAHNTLK
jgi:tetratricopeptide (TPR) repeat protein